MKFTILNFLKKNHLNISKCPKLINNNTVIGYLKDRVEAKRESTPHRKRGGKTEETAPTQAKTFPFLLRDSCNNRRMQACLPMANRQVLNDRCSKIERTLENRGRK